MKIFTNKRLFKKIVIVVIAIMLFSVVVPPKVTYASDDSASKVGGALLSPIASLLIGLGDVLMNIIHKTVYDMDSSYFLIEKKDEGWGIFLTIVVAIIAIIVVAVVAYFTAGAGLALLAKLGITATIGASTIGTIVTISLTAGVVAGAVTAMAWFGDNFVFPTYKVSPEEIFRNEVDLLDINFFEPKTKVNYEVTLSEGKWGKNGEFPWTDLKNVIGNSWERQSFITSETLNTVVPDNLWQDAREGNVIEDTAGMFYINATPYPELSQIVGAQYELSFYQEKAKNNANLKKELDSILSKMNIDPNDKRIQEFDFKLTLQVEVKPIDGLSVTDLVMAEVRRMIDDNSDFDIMWNLYGYDKFIVTARLNGEVFGKLEQIFLYRQVQDLYEMEGEYQGKVSYIIYEKTQDGMIAEETKLVSLGGQLKETVTKWYYTIRNFVLVIMMLILAYIGIRIIISGISSEKAKYKNMLMDWLVAICLVFIMHYIMVFAINIVDGITNIFASLGNGGDKYVNIYEINNDLYDKLVEELSKEKVDSLIVKENGNAVINNDGNKYLMWDAQNMVGMARIQAALCNSGTITYIGYGVIFLVLVFYTIFFLFTYIKRALYLTFFTIIAPLVAMTYPIDKLHDGKAQAFNMWFKEYIFNLMIQPVHLLLYTILISSALELASSNMLYALVAIGFMMPAEKFVRKMFGFNKAETPGFLEGAAGAGILMGMANKIFTKKSHGGSRGQVQDGGDKSGKENKISMKDDSSVDPFLLSGSAANNAAGGNSGGKTGKGIKVVPKLVSKQKKAGATATGNSQNAGTNGTPKSVVPKTGTGGAAKPKISQTAKPKSSGFWARQGRGLKVAGKSYFKGKAIKFGRSLASGKPIKDIAKLAGGLYLGATGALLGGTIGLASGSPKNIGQYGAGLGVAGYGIGARDIKSDPDLENAYREYERGQYGSEEEYRRHLLEEQRKQVISDDKNVEQIRTYLQLQDQQEAREYMERYGECIDAGITDMEDLSTIVQLVEQQGWEKDMAITAAKYYKKAGGKPKNMGKKDRENIEFQYRNIVRANGITDEQQVDAAVKTMLSNLDRYGKVKDDLTQV